MERTKAEKILSVIMWTLGVILIVKIVFDIHGCSHTQGVIDHASGKVQAIENPDGTWWVGKPKEAK